MKITGYRCLQTFHDWGRPVGDVNGYIDSGVTEVPIVVLETDEGVEGIGTGSHQDLERLFPAIEGEDPRAVSALYDRMLSRVFKAGHGGATFGGIGTLDMAIWDIKAKLAGQPLWRLLGARDRYVTDPRIHGRNYSALGDRYVYQRDAGGRIVRRSMQRRASIGGMSWRDTAAFLVPYSRRGIDGVGQPSIVGTVDLRAYAAWLKASYGIEIGY